MTDNTPLNIDDELLTKMRRLGEKYYGNELYGEHLQYQHELQELILADRKKHELQVEKETLERLLPYIKRPGLYDLDLVAKEYLGRLKLVEQELEKL